ncbi:hypothetical protein WMF38_57715 [Sorangium sp. So ce118]
MMSVVVKWKADGDYLAGFPGEVGTGWRGWSPRKSDALRFDSRADAISKMVEHTGLPRRDMCNGLSFVRLVPKRRAAHAVAHGGVTVTAPETMTLGDVWAALSSAPALRVCLDGEKRRAHADGILEGLRRALGVVESVEPDGYDAEECHDLILHGIKHAIEIAAPGSAVDANPGGSEVPDEAGMRVERRGDGEYIVNSGYVINACPEKSNGWLCHYHHDGEHLATVPDGDAADGAELIAARWPIAPATEVA